MSTRSLEVERRGSCQAPPVNDPVLTALGSVVLTVGSGPEDVDVVALWQVSPEGIATGAWAAPKSEVFGQPELAKQFLACANRRAVTGRDRDSATNVMTRLSEAAGIELSQGLLDSTSFGLAETFTDVLEWRREYELFVEQQRWHNKRIVPLDWQRDLSNEPTPVDLDGLQKLSRLAVPPGASAVSEALLGSRLLRWLVGLWSETEQTKNRRRYVADKFGPPTALPPTWLNAVQAAYHSKLTV
ncbi:MAG: DUF6218 family protein [Pseudonocardiaceae bacterium]